MVKRLFKSWFPTNQRPVHLQQTHHLTGQQPFPIHRAKHIPTLPLILAKTGKQVRITSIEGGIRVQSRLADLGLLPNVEVRVLNRSGNGPLLIMVKGSRLALGRELGRKIMVE